MKTVGIIGAGAAGLCALRHALTASPNIVPVIWEQSKVVGGTWVYTDNIDKDDHGLPVHSSMYKSLRTNLPKEVMSFPDFPFPAEGDSFIPHAAMLRYLQDYSQNFDLERHIKFEHVVLEVVPSKPGASDTEWIVTVRDLTSDKLTTTLCHALLICNGHYSVPYIPSIDGIENFCGSTMHSHSYREASPYSDQTVAVLGASASGLDISVELCSVAKKVYLCHNLPIPFPAALPSNLEQKAGIVGVKQGTSNTLVLKDGSELEVDALLYCTGYYYTFPFLADSCGVTVEDQQVWPLYRHLIHCDYPTLAFVGIPTKILPFPLFDIQVRFFLRFLTGEMSLPSCSEMHDDALAYHNRCLQEGCPPKQLHLLASKQWDYVAELARLANLPNIPSEVRQLYELVHGIRKYDLLTFKQKKFVIGQDGIYREM
ncbi:hypothetical protein HAZT_HAZT009104 [Hyalella azteca]|uniref:Flavin-containing monooxygenase n=1 Tax=Hyalella azteca TaxID=294128 RepID=A0A6A0HCA2_HYAAZ|nr:flavin-containing monooxygenase FMO GS-OX-like 4 isoform X2 [Hyalella azteca]KAA0202625.1 hypothetical protein HAZT_HAZT009104 [Hyalella azteca]